MVKQKLNQKALGYSLALFFALLMLIFGILGLLGIYMNGVEAMMQWHLFFDITVVGIIAGIIEAGIFGFIAGWLIAYYYNIFS